MHWFSHNPIIDYVWYCLSDITPVNDFESLIQEVCDGSAEGAARLGSRIVTGDDLPKGCAEQACSAGLLDAIVLRLRWWQTAAVNVPPPQVH